MAPFTVFAQTVAVLLYLPSPLPSMHDQEDFYGLLDAILADQKEEASAHKAYYMANPQAYLDKLEELERFDEVTNGPLVGILLSAGFSGLAGASWLAIGLGVVSGLVQWWLAPQPPRERQPDAQFTPEYGSESLGGFARYGQTKPAIFCSRSLDPTGGVVTGGDLLHSRIETRDGSQTTIARYSLGWGEIGNVDLSQTTINEQPISQFSSRDVKLAWQPGRDDQAALPDYPFFSQNVPATVNNTCGAGLVSKSVNAGSDKIGVDKPENFTKTYNVFLGARATRWYRLNTVPERFFTIADVDIANKTITTNQDLSKWLAIGQTVQFSTPSGGIAGTITSLPIPTSSVFNVPAEEFESYNSGVKYLAITDATSVQNVIYTPFRAIEKIKIVQDNRAYYSITSDTQLPPGNAAIYTYNVIQYQTTKQVNRLDLNFRCNVWARNDRGELIDFCQIYSLWIKKFDAPSFTRIAFFYIRSVNPGTLYRSIELSNLALDNYQIEVRPELVTGTGSFGNTPAWNLKSEGGYDFRDNPGGFQVRVNSQSSINSDSIAFLSGIANQSKDRAPDNSAQRGSTLVLMHCNEIQTTTQSGLPVDVRYAGLATVEARVKASEGLAGNLTFAFFVSEGIVVNRLIGTGEATSESDGKRFVSKDLVPTAPGTKWIRNLSKRKQGLVLSQSPYQIFTSQNLEWEEGDEALLFTRASSCWWPEIRAELASNPKFGAAGVLLADYYLDWPSLIRATAWCAGNNEHDTKFAWHGTITAAGEMAQINNDECKKVLLAPARIDGRSGYFEQKTPPIKAFYNLFNCKDLRVEYLASERTSNNTVVVTYREQEATGGKLKFNPRTITAQTWAAYLGEEAEKRVSIQLNECTNFAQAKRTAQIMLNTSRYGGKIATSLEGASIESISLEVGSLIDVRSPDTVYSQEYSGLVVDIDLDNKWRLDKDLVAVASVTKGSQINSLYDPVIDFIAAGVQEFDVVRLKGGADGVVIEVRQHELTFSNFLIPDKTDYTVISMNYQGDMVCSGIGKDNSVFVQGVTMELVDGVQRMRLNGTQPEVGSLVAIGRITERKRLCQCLSITPTIGQPDEEGRSEVSVGIVASNWDTRIFDYSDVVVISRRGVENSP